MRKAFQFMAVGAVLLTAVSAFGQVPFEFFGNGGDGGIFPEEDSGWDGDLIRISHDGNGGVSNGVSWNSAVTGEYSKLEFDFEFRIWNEDGAGDADGIGFAYADIELWGDEADEDESFWGGGEEPNLEGSLGIGFDTWMNSALDLPGAEDATLPNSVSLHYDGLLVVSLAMEDLDLPDDFIQDAQVKRAHVEVSQDAGGDGLVNLTITNVDPDSGAVGDTFTIFDGEPVPDFEPYDGRIVYKARTGGENSNQDVDNISITRTLVDGTVEDPVVHYGQHVGGGGGGVACDFDGDGSLGVGDIDAMLAVVKAGTNTGSFDLTGDGAVNSADIVAFVSSADKLNTYIGDANLDGEFNSSDFVALFNAGQYEDGVAGNSTWATGDFNGDGEFDSGDFVAAFNDGGYELGPRAAAAVPEPSSCILLLSGLLLVVRRRR